MMRRRLFWRIYLTLLASLFLTALALGTLFWFLGEAQREAGRTSAPWPAQATQYAADGHEVAARGDPIGVAEADRGRHFGPGRVVRFELPDGGFVLTRFGPPPGTRALHLLAVLLAVVGGVGLAAYPVTVALTRRLEALRAGVARWGEDRRPTALDERGHDEVALLARAFNAAAGRLDALVAGQKALLANASHELRSPLARLRMAVELSGEGGARRAETLRNLAEMDQLVDELLLSSRLDHAEGGDLRQERVDLLGLAAEEGARHDARVEGEAVDVLGDPLLLRRLLRNLVENGMRHGRPPVTVRVTRDGAGAAINVSDAGPGVAAADRERIFEPFYRPAGSSERTGGWGLGLALVRQIARRHGGDARCIAADDGSQFVVQIAGEILAIGDARQRRA